MWTYGYTSAYAWMRINVTQETIRFGLPRLRPHGWWRYGAIRSIRLILKGNGMPHQMLYEPYEAPEEVGWAGAYSVNGECVGFATLDGAFVSMVKLHYNNLTPPV
jgi:hypothetical protein